jgi:hypothetical protein
MSQLTKRPSGIYIVVVWLVINIAVFALLIPGDTADLNNYIEPVLLAVSIVGLLLMKKVGAAFATATLCISLSTSMGIVLLNYYSLPTAETSEVVNTLLTAAGINALRIALNVVAVVYLFKLIFANKFH